MKKIYDRYGFYPFQCLTQAQRHSIFVLFYLCVIRVFLWKNQAALISTILSNIDEMEPQIQSHDAVD